MDYDARCKIFEMTNGRFNDIVFDDDGVPCFVYKTLDTDEIIVKERIEKIVFESNKDVGLSFSQRIDLGLCFKQWANNNSVAFDPMSVVTYLQINNLLDVGNCIDFLKGEK